MEHSHHQRESHDYHNQFMHGTNPHLYPHTHTTYMHTHAHTLTRTHTHTHTTYMHTHTHTHTHTHAHTHTHTHTHAHRVGPKASAICIYDAANTRDPAVVGDGNGMGIFDIFRGNVIEAIEDNALPDVERPNFFFEVREGGREGGGA